MFSKQRDLLDIAEWSISRPAIYLNNRDTTTRRAVGYQALHQHHPTPALAQSQITTTHRPHAASGRSSAKPLRPQTLITNTIACAFSCREQVPSYYSRLPAMAEAWTIDSSNILASFVTDSSNCPFSYMGRSIGRCSVGSISSSLALPC